MRAWEVNILRCSLGMIAFEHKGEGGTSVVSARMSQKPIVRVEEHERSLDEPSAETLRSRCMGRASSRLREEAAVWTKGEHDSEPRSGK
jgi:hypothetical protein